MNLSGLYQTFLNSSGISTDTRNIKENSIFFALKGENFNGNKFAQEALKKGAIAAVIDEEEFLVPGNQIILVDDVLSTLQKLAKFHRTQLEIPVIALTGSNGKTTTKELFSSVLSQAYAITATKGNLNNHIGVPLTLLSFNKKTEIGIVEMGANHPGEIEFLCGIALPDFGYITNFGKAHLEGFGNLQGVIKAKTELYRHLKKDNKKVLVNTRDEQQMKNSEHMDRVTFGDHDSDYPIFLQPGKEFIQLKYEENIFQSHLIGNYNFDNIAAAVALGLYFEVPVDKIQKGIEEYIPDNNRSQLIYKGNNVIIMDGYNANPTSMMAALENFKIQEHKNKLLFLGDMFELGSSSHEEHQLITDYLSKDFIGNTYLIGRNFFDTKTDNPFVNRFKDFEDLEPELKQNPPKDALILIKGSRGMKLERILDLIS